MSLIFDWWSKGREFKSLRPDHFNYLKPRRLCQMTAGLFIALAAGCLTCYLFFPRDGVRRGSICRLFQDLWHDRSRAAVADRGQGKDRIGGAEFRQRFHPAPVVVLP